MFWGAMARPYCDAPIRKPCPGAIYEASGPSPFIKRVLTAMLDQLSCVLRLSWQAFLPASLVRCPPGLITCSASFTHVFLQPVAAVDSETTALQVGYCTNVHAGVELAAVGDNLVRYSVPARKKLNQQIAQQRQVPTQERLGVGLWIPDQASQELMQSPQQLQGFAELLAANRLSAFTINGFPFDNFHQPSVKQRVYLPTWADRQRYEYTLRLASILAALLPESDETQTVGSISTLPLGWPANPFAPGDSDSAEARFAKSGQQLRELAAQLNAIEQQTGKRIVVAIEPEPGCDLDSADDMIDFFDQQLPEQTHRRYLTICHDICHSAVMNEPQRDVIERYAQAGIAIGKVQVSSAITVDWASMAVADRPEVLARLSSFAEDRYLHQTGQVDRQGDFKLATDLPELLAGIDPATLDEVERWMIHFHVPIFLEQIGRLGTSRDAVQACLQGIGCCGDPNGFVPGVDFTGHLEVETYAWTVLPEAERQRGLSDDIATEMFWLLQQLYG